METVFCSGQRTEDKKTEDKKTRKQEDRRQKTEDRVNLTSVCLVGAVAR